MTAISRELKFLNMIDSLGLIARLVIREHLSIYDCGLHLWFFSFLEEFQKAISNLRHMVIELLNEQYSYKRIFKCILECPEMLLYRWRTFNLTI